LLKTEENIKLKTSLTFYSINLKSLYLKWSRFKNHGKGISNYA
jgi:hypothetical protein